MSESVNLTSVVQSAFSDMHAKLDAIKLNVLEQAECSEEAQLEREVRARAERMLKILADHEAHIKQQCNEAADRVNELYREFNQKCERLRAGYAFLEGIKLPYNFKDHIEAARSLSALSLEGLETLSAFIEAARCCKEEEKNA